MKNLLFLLFCFFTVNAYAQHSYISIPEDSVLWVVVDENWHESDPSNPPNTFSYEVHWMEGVDTIANNTRYSCMYFGYQTDMPPSYGNSAINALWIRQDTITKKIWRVSSKGIPPNYVPVENLIYDFSLQTGDTFNDPAHEYFGSYLSPYKAWIEAMDSLYWTDGTWRYRWFIKSDLGASWGNPANAVQIEGTGYINRPVMAHPFTKWMGVFNDTYEVTCFGVKGQWLYTKPNPWNFDCDSMISRNMLGILNVPDVVINDLEQPLLYPNPVSTTGKLMLNKHAGPSQELHQVQAYDIHGRLVLSAALLPGNSIELAPYSFHPGMYFFRVSNSRQQSIYAGKILLQ